MVTWHTIEPGIVSYQTGLDLQYSYLERAKNSENHYLLLLEHLAVITMGRRTDPTHILLEKDELIDQNIELFQVDRGGSATFHAPGQLVGYIICKSSRMGGIHLLVSRILKTLQEVIISFGIDCIVDEDNPGIWTVSSPPRKLAAVGMQNIEGYTMHGFALNIHLPLTGFQYILPCGLDLPVSTMSIELGTILRVNTVKERLKESLLLNFNKKMQLKI